MECVVVSIVSPLIFVLGYLLGKTGNPFAIVITKADKVVTGKSKKEKVYFQPGVTHLTDAKEYNFAKLKMEDDDG